MSSVTSPVSMVWRRVSLMENGSSEGADEMIASIPFWCFSSILAMRFWQWEVLFSTKDAHCMGLLRTVQSSRLKRSRILIASRYASMYLKLLIEESICVASSLIFLIKESSFLAMSFCSATSSVWSSSVNVMPQKRERRLRLSTVLLFFSLLLVLTKSLRISWTTLSVIKSSKGLVPDSI